MFEKAFLIAHEKKHLSREYRTNPKLMESLLHDDFVEIGVSGKTYNKDAILKAMPLDVFTYTIEDFSFCLEDDYVHTSYTLVKDITNKRTCQSIWVKTLSGLSLVYFKSETI